EGAPPETAADPFGAEPIWLLKEGALPQPYNLDTLVIWTLFFGLVHQDTQRGLEGSSQIAELTRMLRDDLVTEEHWFLAVKSQLERLAQGRDGQLITFEDLPGSVFPRQFRVTGQERGKRCPTLLLEAVQPLPPADATSGSRMAKPAESASVFPNRWQGQFLAE